MKNSPVAPNKEDDKPDVPKDIEYYEIEHEPFFAISNKKGYKTGRCREAEERAV